MFLLTYHLLLLEVEVLVAQSLSASALSCGTGFDPTQGTTSILLITKMLGLLIFFACW